MRESTTSSGARVVKVAAGLESSDRHVPVRDLRHEALGALTGKWINEGYTVAEGRGLGPAITVSDCSGYGRRPV